MGFLNGFASQAQELTAKQMYLEFGSFLIEGENIDKAIKVEKDKMIFTNIRLFIVQFCKGNKFEFLSIPYSKIRKFSIVGTEIKDPAAELNIYLLDEEKPIRKLLKNIELLTEVYQLLSKRVFGQSLQAQELAVVKMN